jgi:hypothetical protein
VGAPSFEDWIEPLLDGFRSGQQNSDHRRRF